ncbi:hypothetical protein Arub01_37350 [Actinomadura rubrobrunea]|uniref:Uncharacterized protein n=1 Tax=Actinomadura rubrobrunea TaxID=115335 RepID=A0A9W6UVA9_9ACTN|nr:hypothetical protein [Actinomadura rubrobrunea]GLW65491.1 hypothetical protein Arub01_37350 [Actinomadura rubrobrunea]
MFVQVIQGRIVTDPARLKECLDLWARDLAPGASGWLGETAGVTDDGMFVDLVRFASPEAARRNGDRPEQGRWWAQTSRLLGGEVTFRDCVETDTWLGGASDDAGFVQVIQSKVTDLPELRSRLRAMDDDAVRAFRPDVIGGVLAVDPGGVCTEAVYFTSETAAREGERRLPAPELLEKMEGLMRCYEGELAYYDLRDPWLYSP